ncbi:hypothetical protein FRC75_12615 [Paracidovorax citrulli]|nr:hypothetical protein FRC75_12615 [Paracidovorax citrulli]
MQRQVAIDLLGGTTAAAAEVLGVSYQAVSKWPDPLPGRIRDRVVAACVYEAIELPPDIVGCRKRSRLAGAEQAVQTAEAPHG